MSYSTNIPASQPPAQSRIQINTNSTRIQTIVGNEHQFNDSADSTDGQHLIINHKQQTAPSAGSSCKTYAAEVNSTFGDFLFTTGLTGKSSGNCATPLTSTHSNGAVPDGTLIINCSGLTRAFFDVYIMNQAGTKAGFARYFFNGSSLIRQESSMPSGFSISSSGGNSIAVFGGPFFWSINFIRLEF